MRTPYFATAAACAALESEARSWLGTPFFSNAASKGFGVGCVNLIHEIFATIGAVPRLTLPIYTLDRGHHSANSQLLQFLLQEPALRDRLVFVPMLQPSMPGDLYALRSGHIDHHLVLQIGSGQVIHAVEDLGVITQPATDDLITRRTLYRLRLLASAK